MGLGIQPDILICRTEKAFGKDSKKKISTFCNLSYDSVIMLENVDTIYKVPLKLFDEGLLKKLYLHFNLKTNKKTNLSLWKQFEAKFKNLKKGSKYCYCWEIYQFIRII